MRTEDCERIRDELPALLDGSAPGPGREVRAHLATCADCSAELELLRALAGRTATVPAGLESRILQDLGRRTGRAYAGLQGLAMAATVAFALITAGVLMTYNGTEPADGFDLPEEWLGPETPRILGGAPGLEALSEDELVRLLEELDS